MLGVDGLVVGMASGSSTGTARIIAGFRSGVAVVFVASGGVGVGGLEVPVGGSER